MAASMGWCFSYGFLVLTICGAAVFQVATGQGVTIEQIRLVGGNITAGRLEVRVGGVWGTVCDDAWDVKDATVVCKQLGLTGGEPTIRASPFGAGTGTIFLDDVDCKGNEKNLQDCYFTTDENCGHDEDAGVICLPAGAATTPSPVATTTQAGVTQPDNCQTGSNTQSQVRLYGPESQPGVGFVQVKAPGENRYGFVCDDFWDVNAAKVVCNELCYNVSLSEPGMKKEFYVGVPTVNFFLDDVQCQGNEGSLVDCQHDTWFQDNCDDSELAAVTCVEVTYSTPVPPSPGLECREGSLIALFSKARDPLLEPKYFTLAEACNGFTVVNTETANGEKFITATIPFEDCGTNVTQNQTHIVYSNTIFLESTSRQGAITRVNDYRIELTCEMPRNATVDREVKPLTETVTQTSVGQFNVTMTIYQDQRFSQPVLVYPYELTLGHWLNAAIELESIDSRLKLVVTDCIGSPDLNDANAPTVTLLEDKCVADRATLETLPLSKVKFGLRLQSFVFVNYPLVVLQCHAIICLTSEVTSECDRSCNNTKPPPNYNGDGSGNRRRRDVSESDAGAGASSGPKAVYTVSSHPVVVLVPLNTSTALPSSASPLQPTTTSTTTTSPTTTSPPTTTTRSAATSAANSGTTNAATTTSAAATTTSTATSTIEPSTIKSTTTRMNTTTTTTDTTTTTTTTTGKGESTSSSSSSSSSSLSPVTNASTGEERVFPSPPTSTPKPADTTTGRAPILITVRGTIRPSTPSPTPTTTVPIEGSSGAMPVRAGPGWSSGSRSAIVCSLACLLYLSLWWC